MSCKPFLATVAMLSSLFMPRDGATQNGIVEFEIPFSHTEPYVECLGEGIEINLNVTIRTHLVEGQNGGFHYVENWFMEGTAVGLDSGLTWFARGVSPYLSNANGAQSSEGWVVAVRFEPLDGGRKFRERWPLRVVYDANGVPRVEQFGAQEFICIGGPR